MRSPFLFTFPLIVQFGDGAPTAHADPHSCACAVIGTVTAPSITVLQLRWRQSQGAINAPLHRPRLASRACSSSTV